MTRHNAMFRFNFFRRSYVDEDEAGFMFYYGCYIYRGGMCYVCACSLHACVRVLYMRTRTCVCVCVGVLPNAVGHRLSSAPVPV